MRQYLGIVQIFLFFCCILQSNSTLTSSYLSTPSILLYQVQRECARTLTIVAALLYIIRVVVESNLYIDENIGTYLDGKMKTAEKHTTGMNGLFGS